MAAAEAFDYVVIGGGHNGLCAGATLAERGRSVCVVEKLPIAGGLSASHNYIGDAPEHLLSLGAMDDMFMAQTSLAQDMRLADHGYETVALDHPYGWMNEDGDTLLLWHDFARTLQDIRHFSPRDARTYEQLRGPIDWIMDFADRFVPRHPAAFSKLDVAKMLLRNRPDRATRRLLQRMLSTNVFELISDTFESDAMRGLWAYWSSMVGPADADGGGVFFLGFAGVHRRRGVLRPRGGMTNLASAFQGALEARGGELRLGAGVERIVVDGGRATGVLLEDGARLEAKRGVLANPAPQVTLGQLVPPDALSREDRNKVAMIPCNSINAAAFKIDIATEGRIGYPKAEAARAKRDDADIRTTTFMTGTLEDHIEQLHAMKSGLNVQTPPVYMAVLSAADRTIASEEGDVLYLHSNVPAHPNDGWPANKEGYTTQIMDSAQRFLGGLDTEIGRMVSTPKDFEDRFAAPRGAYFHVDMLPTRMGMNRPARGLGGYETPIARLFQSGAGTHPGGGVSGWPGRLAALHALDTEAG